MQLQDGWLQSAGFYCHHHHVSQQGATDNARVNARLAGCGDLCDTDLYASFLSTTRSFPSLRACVGRRRCSEHSEPRRETGLLRMHSANGTPSEGASFLYRAPPRTLVAPSDPSACTAPARLLQEPSVCLTCRRLSVWVVG